VVLARIGTGDNGALALERKIAENYDAIEKNEQAALKAKGKISNVINGDVEEFNFKKYHGKYDCIIISEVLEHLQDPWNVVKRIAPTLKPGGLIFSSSPNIASYKIIWQLLKGRFDYTSVGIMDKTHTKWFTPHSYEKMFIDADLKTIKLDSVAPLRKKPALLHLLTLKKFHHLWYNQIMYVGQNQD